MSRHAELLLLLAITTLGAFLRLYRLGELPPGDGHDVAQYGVDALQILNGARPVFLETNFGREPLFSYLVAIAYRFVGPGAFGIHLVSALVGIATIPAIWLAARELFVHERNGLLSYAPLLAALLAAVSYWHLNWSRVGLRVILVPLFAALITFALWRAFGATQPDRLRQPARSWGWFIATGALLGLSLYTYQAARLLPVLVVVGFVLHAFWRGWWTRPHTIGLLLTAAATLVVFMPLGVYAWQHPGALSVRIQQATVVQPGLPLDEQINELARQAATALSTYSLRGDTDPQFTIAGRPSLNPFLSLGLLLGGLVAAWRWRRPPYLYLLAWLALMTAPAMVADQAATAKRYLGAFPAVMVLAALGLLWPLERLRATAGRRPPAAGNRLWPRLYLAFVVAGLLYTAVVTWRDYFVVWAADPDLPAHFQADYRAIGEYIGGLDHDAPVWISPFPADHPVIQLHAGLPTALRGYNGRFCLPHSDPVGPRGAVYLIVPGLQDQSLETLQRLYPAGETIEGPLRPGSDRPYYRAFHVPPGARPIDDVISATAANWGSFELVGYEMNGTVAAGETLDVSLTYRATSATPTNYIAFVHLLGPTKPDGSPLWAQSDAEPCDGGLPTGRWQPGDLIRDTITLTIPDGAPPGEYRLVTGFYSWPDLVRLPVDAGDAVELVAVTLP